MEELIYSIDWEQVKNSFDIFMWGDPNIPTVKAAVNWVPMAIQAVGLITQGLSTIKKNRERKLAIGKYKEDKAALEAVSITNPYKDMTNPYGNLTVNQKQAQFLAQQSQQGLANRMQSLRGAAGASGVSSLAQSIANERTKNLQGISGMIGQQEAANQRLSAQGQLQTEAMIRQGEQTRQVREEQRKMGLAGMSQYQAAMGQQMYNQAIGGVGQAVGQLGGAIADKMELDKLDEDKTNLIGGITTDDTTSSTGITPAGVNTTSVLQEELSEKQVTWQKTIDNMKGNIYSNLGDTKHEGLGVYSNVIDKTSPAPGFTGTLTIGPGPTNHQTLWSMASSMPVMNAYPNWTTEQIVDILMRKNNITDSTQLKMGQEIKY